MASGQILQVMSGLRHRPAATDGELVQRFAAARDADAFAEIVRRHGPMVLGVCRRLVRDSHEAEDAFQAVFLVLVRRAGSVRPAEMVGSWLHGVAYRTAARVKANAQRRPRSLEQQPAVEMAPGDDGLKAILDRELSRLPDKYRLPIVLCDLEGHSRKQTAARLGWPEGTVAGRLARGRAQLGKRLLRLGVAPAAAGVAFVGQAACAAVPARLTAAVRDACLTGVVPEPISALAGAVAGSLGSKWKAALVGVVSLGLFTVGGGFGTDDAQACHFRRRAAATACVPCPSVPCLPLVVAPPAPPVPPVPEEKPKVANDFDPNNRLDAVLLQCAEAVGQMKSVHVRNVVRTDRDATGKILATWRGEIRSLSSGLFALRLTKDDTPSEFELFVVTTVYCYEYRQAFKKLMIHELPAGSPENRADNFLGLMLSGEWFHPRGLILPNDPNAPSAPRSLLEGFALMKQRCAVALSKDVSPNNPHWIYIDIKSRSRVNREYSQAQLVVNAATMLPRRLWFEHLSGSQVTWEFPEVDTKVQLVPLNFRPPEPPKDWETVRVALPHGKP